MSMQQSTQQITLRERVAEAARDYAGILWERSCGEFVRNVLIEQGVTVEGDLKRLGSAINPNKRMPGDVVFFYREPEDVKNNTPNRVGILTDCERYVGKHGNRIEESALGHVVVGYLPPFIGRSDGLPLEYIVVRRI